MPQLILEKLHLVHFKSYEDASFEFSEGLNCIVGTNGSGKTNLLDAIYWLGLTKSAFHNQDTHSIQHQTDFMLIDGLFLKNKKLIKITCSLQIGQRKAILRDKKAYDRISDHVGEFPIVLIAPNDTDIVREGSEERRRFIDAILCQIDRSYLQNLLQYNKILSQRNTVLKVFAEQNTIDHDLLDTYDYTLLNLANLIFDRRTRFLLNFEPIVKKYYSYLSNNQEEINIRYESDIEELDFRIVFRQHRQRDIQAQRTLIGIHKDDFLFEMNKQPLKRFGSQGQQKSFVMALRLAQFELLAVEKEMKPLLLLDDIFDKLDERRILKLIELIEQNTFGQVFLTDARPERTKQLLVKLEAKIKFIHTST